MLLARLMKPQDTCVGGSGRHVASPPASRGGLLHFFVSFLSLAPHKIANATRSLILSTTQTHYGTLANLTLVI